MNKKLISAILLFLYFGILRAQTDIEQVDSLSTPLFQQSLDSIANLIGVHLNDSEKRILNTDRDKIALGQWDPTRRLQGRTAGLNVYANSYSAGASSKITFRGNRSLQNSNQPLILFNGIPINNDEWNNGTAGTDQSNRFIDIDPHLIESIDFTKSMSARARYGIVGANGVIAIKTKKGYKSKPRITVSSTVSSSQVTNLPKLQYEYAAGSIVNGAITYRGPETAESTSWGPAISQLSFDGDTSYPFDVNGSLSITNNGLPANVYDPLDFFTNGISHNQSLQIMGGTEKLSYMVTGSLNNQRDVIQTNQHNKLNLGATIGFNPMDKLELQLTANISSSNAKRSQTGSNLSGIMFGLLRTPVSFDNANGFSDPLNTPESYTQASGFQRAFRPGIYDNPYWSLNRNKHEDKVNRQVLQISGSYELLENLDIQFNAGFDSYNDFRVGGRDKSEGQRGEYLGSAYERNFVFNSENIGLSAKYKLINSENLSLNSTLALSYNQGKLSSEITEGFELQGPNMVEIANTVETNSFSSLFDNKRSGGLLALDFAYMEYLELNASIRQDYSNKFGSDTNGFLSYGIGFDFSILNFINKGQNKSPFELILNGSYGRFGNEFLAGNEIGIYESVFISGDGFISGIDDFGLELNPLIPSINLTAESTSGYDIGLDIFSSQRIRLGILYYNEISDGIIYNRPIAGSTGHSNLAENIGVVSNKGFDLMLSVMPVFNQKFAWKLDLNFNKNNNLLEELGDEDEVVFLSGFNSSRSILKVGHPVGVIQGGAFARNEVGQLLIDEEGFPIPSDIREIIGDPNPDWTMYVSNEIRLGKNLSISALVDIKQGGDMWCGTCGVQDYFGKSAKSADQRGSTTVFEGVTETGAMNTMSVELAPNDAPSISGYYLRRYGFGGLSEMSIYDTSWIRLRNVALSYDLKNFIGADIFSEFTCSIFAQNLLLITEYPGIDPETNLTGNSTGFGIDYYNNPGTRTYGFNIKATF